MLDQLSQIVQRRVGKIDLSPLAQRYGDSFVLETPAQALDIAQLLARLALPYLPPSACSVGEQGADALLRFLATMPDELARSIRAVPSFVPPAARAWLEPLVDRFVALSCTVQDVWVHLMGPESEEDDALVEAILWHAPRHVLDFGCGAGYFAHALSLAGVSVEGIELDPLKQAFYLFRAETHGLNKRMRLGRTRDRYDAALALNVLDHMEDPSPALDLFAGLLPTDGLLCTVAAFPHDGWHQSDASVVGVCAARLMREYEASSYPGALPPWGDCWRKKPKAAEPRSNGLPMLLPATVVHPQEDGTCVLHANRFYAQQVVVDSDTAELCKTLNGRNDLRALASLHDIEVEELWELCDALSKAGQLLWLPPIQCNQGARMRDSSEAATHSIQEHSS